MEKVTGIILYMQFTNLCRGNHLKHNLSQFVICLQPTFKEK